jgi:hypothetical protein
MCEAKFLAAGLINDPVGEVAGLVENTEQKVLGGIGPVEKATADAANSVVYAIDRVLLDALNAGGHHNHY